MKENNLKVLHRIYFGFDGKPDICLDYLKTWEEQLPEYEIKHWNADNLPIDLNDYTKALYKEKDHAYLSDYFRWWILREYGGIYLDADIEIVNGRVFNSIIEELEQTKDYNAIIGTEFDASCGLSRFITYTAHSMASYKNSELATFMCSIYENMGVLRHLRKGNHGWTPLAAPFLADLYFIDNIEQKKGLKTNQPEIHKNTKIYPNDYFSPLDVTGVTPIPNTGGYYINFALREASENTCLCHHMASSWTPAQRRDKTVLFADYLYEKQRLEKSILLRLSVDKKIVGSIGIIASIMQLIYSSINFICKILKKKTK